MKYYKLSLVDFYGTDIGLTTEEIEFYNEYCRRSDRAREMDRWSIKIQQSVDKNKINDFDADMTESKSTRE